MSEILPKSWDEVGDFHVLSHKVLYVCERREVTRTPTVKKVWQEPASAE